MRNLVRHILAKGKKGNDYIFSSLKGEFKDHGNMVFCTGMGRSGTHFLARLLDLNGKVASYHLDEIGNPVADSFYQYARWHQIDVDTTPLFAARAFLADKAWQHNQVYFESNPYLNLHVGDLASEFNCKVLIIYRSPKKVVESHYNKGWYQNFEAKFDANSNRIPGYEYSLEHPHHFFGRFFPKEKQAFEEWKSYTRVGKIAWMWATVYKHALQNMDTACCRLVSTEAIGYTTYQRLCGFLEIEPAEEQRFQEVLKARPGKAVYQQRPGWTSKEVEEFEMLTADVHATLQQHEMNIRG